MNARPQIDEARIVSLGPATRIPLGEGKLYDVEGLAIAVFRARDGRVHAVQAQCPHRGGPLADGVLGGSTLVCPLHAFRFDVATGRAIGQECRPLATYPVRVGPGGDLLLALVPA